MTLVENLVTLPERRVGNYEFAQPMPSFDRANSVLYVRFTGG